MNMEKNSLGKRLIIKLSGEVLSSQGQNFDFDKIKSYAQQLKEISQKNHKVAVVVGAGNIWRNAKNNVAKIDRNNSDYIGMVATVMNGLLLEDALRKLGVKVKLLSSINIDKVAAFYNKDLARNWYEQGYVLIFVGGTGSPFFTTDTATALRACELQVDLILMGKSGVDGVYEKDPNQFSDSKRYDEITYQEIIDKKIMVMDKAAALICQENKIRTWVFSANEPQCYIKVLSNKLKSTRIKS